MKKIPIVALLLAIIINYMLPITNVFADEYTYTLTFTIGNNNENEHTMEADGIRLVIDGQYVELRDGDNTIGTAACTNNNTQCTITVTNGPAAKLNYGSNQFTLFMQGHSVDLEFNFSNNENIAVQDYVAPAPPPGPNDPGDNPGNNPGVADHFDGRAVVLWSCGSGVCYHEFSVVDPEHCDPEHPNDEYCAPEIGSFDDGNSTFFKDSDIEADNKPGTTFNVNAQYKGWYLTDEFNKWKDLYEIATGNQINWNTMEPEIILGEPNNNINALIQAAAGTCGQEPDPEEASPDEQTEYNDCIHLYAAQQGEIWTHKLQPVGEPEGHNAFVSYGDRNFKVVIFNDDYRGVTTTLDFNGLNFYPARWADPYLRTDQYDVSDTNEVNPTPLESILLEDTVNFDVLPYNNYELDSIVALDVPDGAVTITKINSRKFRIEFSSNFYDHVVFKLTDTHGDESYVQINRYTIDGTIRYDNDRNIPVLSADFYFDRTKSHNNFNITAKIIYKDGTIENVTLNAANGFRDGLGNPIEGYEADQEATIGPFQGKGLKLSVFEYELPQNADRNIKDIYFNAEYKGGDAYTYAGAYSGSGEGTPANIYRPEGGE